MSVHYAIRPALPAAHLFHVVCRLERPELAADIAHLLTAASTPVRAEAVNALGQAVTRGGAAGVRRLLEDRL